MRESGWTVQEIISGWAYLRKEAYVYALPAKWLPRGVECGERLYTAGLKIGGYFLF